MLSAGARCIPIGYVGSEPEAHGLGRLLGADLGEETMRLETFLGNTHECFLIRISHWLRLPSIVHKL